MFVFYHLFNPLVTWRVLVPGYKKSPKKKRFPVCLLHHPWTCLPFTPLVFNSPWSIKLNKIWKPRKTRWFQIPLLTFLFCSSGVHRKVANIPASAQVKKPLNIDTRFWPFFQGYPALKPVFFINTRFFGPKNLKCNIWMSKVSCRVANTTIRSVIENYITSCNL